MSLRRTLDVMAATVGRATSVPLSASCLVNRAELLSLVERAKAELPAELDEAAALLVAHQEVIEDAERDRDAMLAEARAQVEEMLAETAVVAAAQDRAEQLLAAARAEAARLLRQADEYCDAKLAGFETDLERLTAQVRRGRTRLRERSELDAATLAGAVEQQAPELDEYEESGEQLDSVDVASVVAPVVSDEPYDRVEDAESAGPLPAQAGPDRVIDLTTVEAAQGEQVRVAR